VKLLIYSNRHSVIKFAFRIEDFRSVIHVSVPNKRLHHVPINFQCFISLRIIFTHGRPICVYDYVNYIIAYLLSLETTQTRSTVYSILFIYLTSRVIICLANHYCHLNSSKCFARFRLLIHSIIYARIYRTVAFMNTGVVAYNCSANNYFY
jgi:hypothetical protein